ncbi:MAG: hypothetical protein AB2L24_30755 [Mangrovibacterium sp.]
MIKISGILANQTFPEAKPDQYFVSMYSVSTGEGGSEVNFSTFAACIFELSNVPDEKTARLM